MDCDKYIDIIIEYWFGDKPDFDRWFKNGSKYDQEITKTFSGILKMAEDGFLEHWSDTLDGFIAYIILTDQFARQIYRGRPEAYANDKNTVVFMEKHLHKYIGSLSAIQLLFVLMPYQHTENLHAQKRGLDIIEKLHKNETIASEKKILKEALDHQKGHWTVIKRFGRFPKRNQYIPSRSSTKEELTYILDTVKLNLPY